jgi:hypothetical protein
MGLLFINQIINQDWKQLEMLAVILVIFYSCVLSAILIDLFFGVRRARLQGVVRTSYGFRRTISKATIYFGLLMLLTIADVLASIVFKLPYFTAIGAIGLVLTELKSVFENIRNENKNIEDVPKILLELYRNKDSIEEIITFLNSNVSDKKEDNPDKEEIKWEQEHGTSEAGRILK